MRENALKNIKTKYFIAFGIYCSVSLLIFILFNQYCNVYQEICTSSFDGDDMLVGILSVQIGFVAFILPLMMDMIYRVSEQFSPYQKLYIDYLFKETELKSNLISGCLCIGFVLVGIWGYTYIPSNCIKPYYLAWRAFFEVSGGAWLITNTIFSITGLLKLIKSTRNPIGDKIFHVFMDNILKEVEKIEFPNEKEQLLINDRNNIFRLILKNEKAKYDNIMFFRNFIYYRGESVSDNTRIIKFIDSLLYFWVDEYQDLSSDEKAIKEKLRMIFWRLDEIFKIYLYKKNWSDYKKCIQSIVKSYEHSFYHKADLITIQCRDFLIYHFTGKFEILEDLLRLHNHNEDLIWNYFDYETPINTQHTFYNNLKFGLYYYDVYVSLIIILDYLEKNITEEYKTEKLNLLKYEHKKRSNQFSSIFNSYHFEHLYIDSFFRRYFLMMHDSLFIPNNNTDTIIMNRQWNIDRDKIPNRNRGMLASVTLSEFFKLELDILKEFKREIFLTFKNPTNRKKIIDHLFTEYQRNHSDPYLYYLLQTTETMINLCGNDHKEDLKILLTEIKNKAKTEQNNIEEQEANQPEKRVAFEADIINKIQQGILKYLNDNTSFLNFVFSKSKIDISSLKDQSENFIFSFNATNSMIINAEAPDFSEYIFDIYKTKIMYQILQNQKDKIKKDTIENILKIIEKVKNPDDFIILIDVYSTKLFENELFYKKYYNEYITKQTISEIETQNIDLVQKIDKDYFMILPKALFKKFIIDSEDNKNPLIKIDDFVNKDYEKIIDISFRYKIDLDFDNYQSEIQTFVFENSKGGF